MSREPGSLASCEHAGSLGDLCFGFNVCTSVLVLCSYPGSTAVWIGTENTCFLLAFNSPSSAVSSLFRASGENGVNTFWGSLMSPAVY